MPVPRCPICGQRRGSRAECPGCSDEALRELAREATRVTPQGVDDAVGWSMRYQKRRPRWALAAPGELMARLGLMTMVLRDATAGRYSLPWSAISTLAAAALYVLSPGDLIPDLLGPTGFADDLVVVGITWKLQRRQLLDYCTAKGLAPGRFGLDSDH